MLFCIAGCSQCFAWPALSQMHFVCVTSAEHALPCEGADNSTAVSHACLHPKLPVRPPSLQHPRQCENALILAPGK